jgi:SNF2 family DNA or RNA helicase
MKLMKHQLDAVNTIVSSGRDYWFIEGGMGIGKTAIAIKLAEYLFMNGKITKVLAITPTGVHRQWVEEQLPLFAEVDYEAAFYSGTNKTAENRKVDILLNGKASLKLRYLCVNFNTFSTASNWQQFVEWGKTTDTMIIIDESHLIKAPQATRTKNIVYGFNMNVRRGNTLVQSIRPGGFRLCLTGTPTDGDPSHLWSQYEFLRPNFWGMSYTPYRQRYCMLFTQKIKHGDKTIELKNKIITQKEWRLIRKIENNWDKWGAYAQQRYGITREVFEAIHAQEKYVSAAMHVQELLDITAPCTTIIRKEECLDLPEKIMRKRILEMSPEHRAFYNQIKKDLQGQMDEGVLNITTASALVIRLRQISSGFAPFNIIDGEAVKSELREVCKTNVKLNALLEDIEILAGHPAIVVTQFIHEAEMVRQAAAKHFPDYSIGVKTGSRDEWDGEGPVTEAFKRGDLNILIANERCISQGFNFQNSSYMFFYTNDWSMIQRSQIEDRIHRFGTVKSPTYTDYIYRDTVDGLVYDALVNKKTIAEIIRGMTPKQFVNLL